MAQTIITVRLKDGMERGKEEEEAGDSITLPMIRPQHHAPMN
jgi:hypothetical protein